jgi:hypothetical protein
MHYFSGKMQFYLEIGSLVAAPIALPTTLALLSLRAHGVAERRHFCAYC